MRMSASRIRSINRSIARVNGIICGASDVPRRVFVENAKLPTTTFPRTRLGLSPYQNP